MQAFPRQRMSRVQQPLSCRRQCSMAMAPRNADHAGQWTWPQSRQFTLAYGHGCWVAVGDLD